MRETIIISLYYCSHLKVLLEDEWHASIAF